MSQQISNQPLVLADVFDAFLITKPMLENVSWEWLDVQSNGIYGRNAHEQPSVTNNINSSMHPITNTLMNTYR